jgi:hypothetical protein
MNLTERELDQAFLKLSMLNHVGMAMLQFARSIATTNTQKDPGGIFRLGNVAFSFPPGDAGFRLHVSLDLKKVDPGDLRRLPLQFEGDFFVCDIRNVGNLDAAANYIRHAETQYLAVHPAPASSPFLR